MKCEEVPVQTQLFGQPYGQIYMLFAGCLWCVPSGQQQVFLRNSDRSHRRSLTLRLPLWPPEQELRHQVGWAPLTWSTSYRHGLWICNLDSPSQKGYSVLRCAEVVHFSRFLCRVNPVMRMYVLGDFWFRGIGRIFQAILSPWWQISCMRKLYRAALTRLIHPKN